MSWDESRAVDELLAVGEGIRALRLKCGGEIDIDPERERGFHEEIVAARRERDHDRYREALRRWYIAMCEASYTPPKTGA
jgi:hypothetical protein